MFDKKQSYLFGNEPVKSIAEITLSGNGAVKLTSTGDPFTDQFSLISQYRQLRPYADIDKDMRTLWNINQLDAMKLVFYIRLVTRKVELLDGSETTSVQRGQGMKHEGIMRMIWVAINYPEVFYNNLPLFVAAGCWKDIFQMMSYDIQFHGWKGKVLDWKALGDFILAGLENPNTCNLVKKYLPTIKARSKARTLEAQADTIIGKYIAHRLFGKGQFKADQYHSLNYKQYRQLKVSGTAHQWQQQISRGKLNINFSTVHGRALALLVSGNFLKNNNLETAYEEWILKQPVAKFTGYVYELFKGIEYNSPTYKKITVDKQFGGLIETAKKGMNTKSTFLVARDTSGSMSSNVNGTNVSSNDVAKAIALYFSYLLEGPFASGYVEFASKPTLRLWNGKTPTEKYFNDRAESYGSTNFLGIADLFVEIFRKGTPINQFPKGLLCVSDGEFNRGQLYSGYGYQDSTQESKTNFALFKKKLLDAGFPKDYVDDFKIVLWDIPNSFCSREIRPKFEGYADTPGFFYMGGLDPSGIAFLLGQEPTPENPEPSTPKTARELFEAAMNQELLNLITI